MNLVYMVCSTAVTKNNYLLETAETVSRSQERLYRKIHLKDIENNQIGIRWEKGETMEIQADASQAKRSFCAKARNVRESN